MADRVACVVRHDMDERMSVVRGDEIVVSNAAHPEIGIARPSVGRDDDVRWVRSRFRGVKHHVLLQDAIFRERFLTGFEDMDLAEAH
jgi:hypothetical protein